MPVINGVYTKDFPALGRAPIDTDIIPIAEVANQITYKTTLGEIFNAKVFGTTGRLSKFTSANTLGDSILDEIGNAIHLTNAGTSYASFGIINPGTPGEPGIDNDCYIGSTINNDFTIRVNNIEAARFDTALRFKINNIQNALYDTDKFLVSEDGVVKYRTGAEVLADIGGQGSITLTTTGSSGASTLTGNTLNIPNYSQDLSGFVTLNTVQTITAQKTFSSSGGSDTLIINHSSGSGIALNITKGGNGEGIYVNKTSGSGNAVTVIGTLNATTLVKNGGTSSQFLKADGSVDSNSYALASSLSGYVTLATTQTITGVKTFSNDIRVNNINIGLGGGAVITNTRVGVSALSGNTSGDFNTANGYYSLSSNTSGNSNTANGTISIANNTTGSFNTAYGSISGGINTTGSNNIFLGYNSQGESATESNRTWIGNTDTTSTWLGGNLLLGSRTNATSDKLQVTGGAKITGIITLGSTITNGTYTYTLPSATGTLALTSSLSDYVTLATTQTITGAKTFSLDTIVNGINIGRGGGAIDTNTRVGNGALIANTTGIYNSAFGGISLNANTTGGANTAIGNATMTLNTTGELNTALGYLALSANTTGSGNIAVGFSAGSSFASGGSNQTSTNSVYLGNDTRPSANGNTNEIVIGHSAIGGGSNSATLGNSSIATTILHGNTSIGYTTNPSLYKLDVNGESRFVGRLLVNHATSGNYGAVIYNTSATGEGLVVRGGSTSSHSAFVVQPYDGSVALFNVLATGAATFSSSVTSNVPSGTGTFKINNTSVSKAWSIFPSTNGSQTDINFYEEGTAITAVTFKSGGNVGIGTTSPTQKLTLINGTFQIGGTSTFSDNVEIGRVGGNDNMAFATSGSERMRITSGGNVQPGADNAYSLGVSGTRWSAVWAANGTIQTSDEREKKDIVNSDLGLDFISKLRPVSFKWKVGINKVTNEKVIDAEGNSILDEEGNEINESVITPIEGKRTHYGLIAQEVKDALGDVDFGGFIHDSETDIMGLRYDQFVPLLIKSIQEQQAQIEELKLLIQNK